MNNKGSSTLEATIIIPICLILVIMLVWSGIYYYDRCVLAQAASRSAICGGQIAYHDNSEIALYCESKVQQLTNGKLLLMDNASTTVTVSATEISVNVSGSLNLPDFFGFIYKSGNWNINITEKYARLKSSIIVRTINRLRKE